MKTAFLYGKKPPEAEGPDLMTPELISTRSPDGGIVGNEGMAYSPEFHKYAILGALSLYLDFINLFLMLLRLFGGRSRD